MQDYCREAGVAVVFVRELPGTHVSGATRWLSSDKAMIILSLRHKQNDHFWFSFFHEAGHILHHRKRDIFIDIEGASPYSHEEKEANDFASDFLIPKEKYENFIKTLDKISKESVLKFANKIEIAPGIIVGRLQHEGKLPFTHLNKLKRTITLTE